MLHVFEWIAAYCLGYAVQGYAVGGYALVDVYEAVDGE